MIRTVAARTGAILAMAFVLTVVPLSAHAASATFFGPIVPAQCNCLDQPNPSGGKITTAPSYGCVLATTQNVINFAISLGVILATLALVYAGFTWMTSGGNPEARSKGRGMLMNVFIGLVILLSAWLVVDYIMKKLYNPDATATAGVKYGPWNSILQGSAEDQCIVATTPKAIPGLLGSLATTIVGGQGNPGTPAGGGGTTAGNPSAATGTGSSKMNISSATSFLDSNAASGSTNQCALYVRKALAAGGLTSFDTNHPQYAYQYGSYLTNAGFQTVSASGYAPQQGDVIVFQPVPGHSSGHIEMYDGSQWVSDFKQQTMYPSQDYVKYSGSYTIYRG